MGMRGRSARAAALAVLLALAGMAGTEAGTVGTPECQRDLLVIKSQLEQGQARLQSTVDMGRKEMCAIWRQHVDLAKRAGAIYRRCKTDTERRVLSGEMDTQAMDFQAAIDSSCKGQ